MRLKNDFAYLKYDDKWIYPLKNYPKFEWFEWIVGPSKHLNYKLNLVAAMNRASQWMFSFESSQQIKHCKSSQVFRANA